MSTSCASYFIRKECEKINWFQHGYDVAMSGRRLTGDDQVEKCKKAEFELPEAQVDQGFKAGMENYCKPEIVYKTGKIGDFFNTELCDPGQANVLRRRHQDGVREYCAVDNGYAAGASGKKYQNICPAELEKAFLPEYRRGRKKYLNVLIADGQGQMSTLNSRLQGWQVERNQLSFRLQTLPQPRTVTETKTNFDGTSTQQTQTVDPYSFERNQISSQLNSVNAHINEGQAQQQKLQNSMGEWQRELATLD